MAASYLGAPEWPARLTAGFRGRHNKCQCTAGATKALARGEGTPARLRPRDAPGRKHSGDAQNRRRERDDDTPDAALVALVKAGPPIVWCPLR